MPSAPAPKLIVNRFTPVAEFCGLFVLLVGQTEAYFQNAQLQRTARVMVVAGDGKAYGNASKSVTVSKPVMIPGTLPRVIGAWAKR